MSDYRMDIRGEIKLSDYSSIHDYMGVVGPDDNFTIVLSSEKEDDAKVLCNILESDKFTIVSRGGSSNGKYFIRAHKRK